jgi:hypothetical protein
MPSSFRRNKTQAWLRKSLIDHSDITCLYLNKVVGFVNTNRLFSDLPAVLQYDLVVADNQKRTHFGIGFGLCTFDELHLQPSRINYPSEAARRLNPGLYTIADVPSSEYAETLGKILSSTSRRASSIFNDDSIAMSQEVNNRSQIKYCEKLELEGQDPRNPGILLQLNREGLIPLIESKSISHYTCNWKGSQKSGWNPVPQYAYPLSQVNVEAKKKAAQILDGCRFYRIIMRQTCGSPYTNERSSVAALLPPGLSAFHSAIVEQNPFATSNALRLEALAVLNSFSFDFVARPQIGANFSLFILSGMPWPNLCVRSGEFLAHLALRLSCNHEGYLALWNEQLAFSEVETFSENDWNPIVDDDDRWLLRGCADAIVAMAYGLDRYGYEQVLSAFSHRSYPKAPFICLDSFDELSDIGLEEFAKKYDPYWRIPRCRSLPQPVIDLPGLVHAGMASSSYGPLFENSSVSAIATAHSLQSPVPSVAPLFTQNAASVDPLANASEVLAVITELLHSRGLITSSDAQQATGLDSAGVRPHLQQLVQMGLAVTEGQRRGMRYRRVDG